VHKGDFSKSPLNFLFVRVARALGQQEPDVSRRRCPRSMPGDSERDDSEEDLDEQRKRRQDIRSFRHGSPVKGDRFQEDDPLSDVLLGSRDGLGQAEMAELVRDQFKELHARGDDSSGGLRTDGMSKAQTNMLLRYMSQVESSRTSTQGLTPQRAKLLRKLMLRKREVHPSAGCDGVEDQSQQFGTAEDDDKLEELIKELGEEPKAPVPKPAARAPRRAAAKRKGSAPEARRAPKNAKQQTGLAAEAEAGGANEDEDEASGEAEAPVSTVEATGLE
ncbi:unnamed protein product, partial [Polarella glacialis]